MTRRSTWEADLSAYIASVRDRPHAYGEHDCATFAAGAVMAMTGEDPIPEFRGTYSTAAGSARALLKHGAGTLNETLNAKFDPAPIAFLRRGDLVWDGEAVGVCMGAHALFVGQEGAREGLVRAERSVWVGGWRVE